MTKEKETEPLPITITLTWAGVVRMIQDLVDAIDTGVHLQRYKDCKFDRLILVSRGGLPIGTLIGNLLDIRKIAIVSAISYEERNQLLNIQMESQADPRTYNRSSCLIVDDISDTGRTMMVMKSLYPKAIRYSMIAKPGGIEAIHLFSQEQAQDVWIEFPWEIKKGVPHYNIPIVSENSQ